MKLTNGKVVRGNDEEQNKINDNQDLPPELKEKKKKSKVKYIKKWKHSDLPVIVISNGTSYSCVTLSSLFVLKIFCNLFIMNLLDMLKTKETIP